MSTVTTPERITEIPLDQLHDSPTNPRQHYPEEYLEELARNIGQVGRVLQPLLVRPRVPELFRSLADAADTAACGYEIVFGHCRRRGAERAGLASVPCMVRSMSDEEVLIAQVSENLQRRDVHPFEEAQGYRSLLDTSQYTADDLAERFGKSRTYIYSRLKLLEAVPEVRRACVAGEIGAEAALLVARVGPHKLQEKALAAIRALYRQGQSGKSHLADGGKLSHRVIRDLLQEKFTLKLSSAIFDIEDELLLPSAMNCVMCPKRAGNAPEFADVTKTEDRSEHTNDHKARSDVCTDPECFEAKRKAHLKREADKAAAAGAIVVTGNAAKAALSAYGEVRGAYVALQKIDGGKKALATATRKSGEIAVPAVVTIQDQRTGKLVQAVKRDDLVKVGLAKAQEKAPSGGSDGHRDRAAERREAEARAEQETAVREALLARVRDAAAARPRSIEDLRIIADTLVDDTDYSSAAELLAELWGCKNCDELRGNIPTMCADDLGRLLLDCALVRAVRVSAWELDDPAEHLEAAATAYGLDVAQVRAEVSAGTGTPPTAARALEDAVGVATPQSAALAPAKAAPSPIWPFPRRPGQAVPSGFRGADDAEGSSAGQQVNDEAGCAGQSQTDNADGMAAGGLPAEVQ